MSGSVRYGNAVSGVVGFEAEVPLKDVIKSVEALRALARKHGATTCSTWVVTSREADPACDEKTVVFVILTLGDDVSVKDFVKVFEEEAGEMPGCIDAVLISGPVTLVQ